MGTEFNNVILHGDCLEILKGLPDASIDSVITDPPYGLGTREPTGEDIVRYLNGSTLDTGGDFMGMEWEIPPVAVWKECFRVLKSGGYVLSFAGTRTWDIMSLGLRAAGFDNRDTIASMFGPSVLSWVHCLTADTEVLTESGWKFQDQVQVGDKVANWDPETAALCFLPVSQKYTAPWCGPLVAFQNDDVHMTVTPNHRVFHKSWEREQKDWVREGAYTPWQAAEAGQIPRTKKIKIPMSGYLEGPGVGEDYAALAGWVWTEGGFDQHGQGVRIYQSETANLDKVAEIDRLLDLLRVRASRYSRERTYEYKGAKKQYVEICWYFSGDTAQRLRADMPEKIPSWAFLWQMSGADRQAFYHASMNGDGNWRSYQFYQTDRESLDRFQTLLTTMGFTGRVYLRSNRSGGHVNIRTKSSTELTIANLQKHVEEHYEGLVWCVEVPTGAFVARQHGRVFVTGNSQGFPKSLNISKALLKMAAARRAGTDAGKDGRTPEQLEELAKKWEGHGTALKPAWEPILCFRKPVEGGIAEQVIATGSGGLNIDGARIKHASPEDLEKHKAMVATLKANGGSLCNSWKNSSDLSGANEVREEGRWPANVLLTHAPGCRKVGTRKVDAPVINRFDDGMKPFGGGAGHAYTSTQTGDPDGKEDVEVYECVPGCPAAQMDAQSGELHTHQGTVTSGMASMGYHGGAGSSREIGPNEGGASRFFAQFVPDAPFYYVAKASRAERNEHLAPRPKRKTKDKVKIVFYKLKDDVDADVYQDIQEALGDDFDPEVTRLEHMIFKEFVPEALQEHFEVDDSVDGNDHPSVKPKALMRYLVRLVTPKDGLVLDPYCGSGTTCQAATEEGRRFIGIEKDPHFFDLAERRVMKSHEEEELDRDQYAMFERMFDFGND